jgi:hypothetical protein
MTQIGMVKQPDEQRRHFEAEAVRIVNAASEKDIIGPLILLLEHPMGGKVDETINIEMVAGLCARDWGLWRTLTMNAQKVAQLSQSYPQLAKAEKHKIEEQVQIYLQIIGDQPKTAGWKIRSRIGDRVKWYQEVDEVQ